MFLTDWSLGEECLEALGRPDRLIQFVSKLRVGMKSLLAGEAARVGQLDQVARLDLGARSLPALAHVLNRTPRGTLVLDLGSGRGRHTVYALQAGLKVVAVEKNAKSFADLVSYVKASGRADSAIPILNDYSEIDLRQFGFPTLVIITGVLQHAKSLTELRKHLSILQQIGIQPLGMIYIEMLFDMLFDGKKPTDNRIELTPDEFDLELTKTFPEPEWKIMRVSGPIRKTQNFRDGARSFYPPAVTIDVTTIEYLISRGE